MTSQAAVTQFGNATQGSTQDLDAALAAAGSAALMYGATSGGSANAQTITVPNRITVHVDGYIYTFIAGFTTTNTATLAVTGGGGASLGVLNLCDAAGVQLTSGAIVAGKRYGFQVCTVSGNTHLRQV